MRRVPVCALGLAGMLAAAGACFSERQSITSTAGGVGACNIPVGSPIFGSTRALIAIRGYSFQPDTIRVQPGTIVTWVNCETPNIDPHTSTSDTQVWSSPLLPPGDTFTRTFLESGTFDYGCVPHPFMRGVVIVE